MVWAAHNIIPDAIGRDFAQIPRRYKLSKKYTRSAKDATIDFPTLRDAETGSGVSSIA
jgi:hypothetical protein